MRTTVNLRDEAYEYARSIAHQERTSLGEVISDLILRRSDRSGDPVVTIGENGFPVVHTTIPLTVESVKRMLDEYDD